MNKNNSQLHNSLKQILAYYRSYNFKNGEFFVLRAAFNPGAQKILIGRIHPDGKGIELYTTAWHEKRKREGKGSVQVYRISRTIPNPVAYLRDLALSPNVTAINSYPNHLKVRWANGCHVTDLGDDNVERFDTLFWEIDDLPLPAQTEKRIWLKEKLGLDVAISVFSGGKSEHNALSLTHDISKEDWLRLNFKLSIVMQGDIAICTAARAMRVPGVPRIKNEAQREVEILYLSDAKYSAAEIESVLDSTGLFPHGVTSIHRSKIRSKLRDPKLNHEEKWQSVIEVLQKTEEELQPHWEYKHSSSLSNNLPIDNSPLEEITDAFPLEICLSLDDRELLANGAGQGMRNNSAVKLLKNLIGTANRLSVLGYNYQGNPETLFFDFCSRCTPALPHNEAVNIWRSISGSNPTATLPDDYLINCINGWHYQQLPEHLKRQVNREFARSFSSQPKKSISKEKEKRISKLIEEIREYHPDFDFKETDPEKLWLLNQHPTDEFQNNRFLALGKNLPRFLAIQSPMYTGKTYQIAQIIKEYPDSSILIVTHLSSLATNFAKQFNCACYSDLHPSEFNDQKRLAITTESLHRLKPFGQKYDIVVIDEVDQQVTSLSLSQTTKKHRHLSMTTLCYFIRNSKHFICGEADLSSLVLGFYEYLCNAKAHLTVNQYKVHQGRIAYRFDDETRHFLHLLEIIKAGGRPLIVSDSKTSVKKNAGVLGGANKHINGFDNLPDEWKEKLKNSVESLEINPLSGLAIHGDNSQSPEIKKFIANINHQLDVEKFDFLVINSALSSGVSIEPSTKAFTHVMCFFKGRILPHTVLTQLPHRLRDLEVEFSYSFQKGSSSNLETDPYAILYDLFTKNKEELNTLGMNSNSGAPEPEVLLLYCGLTARINWSLNNNQWAFEQHMSHLGYELTQHPDEILYQQLPPEQKVMPEQEQEKAKKLLKEHGKAVEKSDFIAISQSKNLTHDEANAFKEKRSLTFEERCSLEKYIISNFTGMNVNEELVSKWYKENIKQNVTRFEQMLNPFLARRLDLASMRNSPYLHDHTHYLLQTELLLKVKLPDYLKLDTIYDNDNLKPLADNVKKNAHLFKKYFNLTIYQPSDSLSELREVSQNTLKQFLTESTPILQKWMLEQFALGTGKKYKDIAKKDLSGKTKKEKEDIKEKHYKEYCEDCFNNTTPVLRMIADTIAIDKRFNVYDMTPNSIYGNLCHLIGIELKKGQKRKGRYSWIDPESWNFNMAIVEHHANQRVERDRRREEIARENGQRFDAMDIESMQKPIVQSIAANKSGEPPDLVFLTENPSCVDTLEKDSKTTKSDPQPNTTIVIPYRDEITNPKINLWVDLTIANILISLEEENLSMEDISISNQTIDLNSVEFEKPTESHSLDYNNKDLSFTGSVTNPQIKLGIEVLVAQIIESLDENGTKKVTPRIAQVENMATGVNDYGDKFNYLKVKFPENKSYWIPIEWCTSVDGAPVVRNPDHYDLKAYPRESIEVLCKWLNGVETAEDFLTWEFGRKRNEINAVIKGLSQSEWIDLAYKLEKWGIKRDWIQIEAIPKEEREDVINACNFLESGINESYEELSHFVDVIKEYLKICPDAVKWLKIALSPSFKEMLARLMPIKSRDLIEKL